MRSRMHYEKLFAPYPDVVTLPEFCTVEADSREEAERMVEQRWNNSEYILDADSFVGVDFAVRTNERSREYER